MCMNIISDSDSDKKDDRARICGVECAHLHSGKKCANIVISRLRNVQRCESSRKALEFSSPWLEQATLPLSLPLSQKMEFRTYAIFASEKGLSKEAYARCVVWSAGVRSKNYYKKYGNRVREHHSFFEASSVNWRSFPKTTDQYLLLFIHHKHEGKTNVQFCHKRHFLSNTQNTDSKTCKHKQL